MEILGLTGSLGTGIGLLLGLALLKYSGYVAAVRKELSYIAAGAVFLNLKTPVFITTIYPEHEFSL